MSVDEIVAYLGRAKDLVSNWASKPKLSGHKVGRHCKFKKNPVDG